MRRPRLNSRSRCTGAPINIGATTGRSIARPATAFGGTAIVGANILRDIFAKVREVVGGRAGGYENAALLKGSNTVGQFRVRRIRS